MRKNGDARFPVLTARFVALAAAVAVLLLVIPVTSLLYGLLIVNALVVAIALVDWVLTPKPSDVKVWRDVPSVIPMGTETHVRWTIENPAARTARISIADALPPSFQASERRFHLRIASEQRGVVDTMIRPSRRGQFTIAALTVHTRGPLGLVGRMGARDYPSVVHVYPPFASRREAELRIESARVLEVGMRSVRSRGGGTEFEQLREYGVDDDYRRIDWAATARFQKPIVRTYRSEQNQNVMILLDTGRLMAAKVGGVTRLEHAIDTALALTTVATRLGDRVGLVAFNDRIKAEVALSRGASHVTRIIESVYRLDAELVESDYRNAFVATMTRAHRRCMVVLLTEPGDQAIDETLLPALPAIARHNLLVVAGVSDPVVSTWAYSTPTETDKVYQKAAAIASLRDRKRCVAQLRSRGATVVDAVPGKLAASVADAYLEVKASGRL